MRATDESTIDETIDETLMRLLILGNVIDFRVMVPYARTHTWTDGRTDKGSC